MAGPSFFLINKRNWRAPSFFLINKRNLRPKTAPARDFRPAVGVRKIGFPLRRPLEKINFLGAGGPPPHDSVPDHPACAHCKCTQNPPPPGGSVQFQTVPGRNSQHTQLLHRTHVDLHGTWEALDGFPNQEHRSTSGDECIIRNTSNARMIHSSPAPRVRLLLRESAAAWITHTHTHTYTNLRLITQWSVLFNH